MDNIIREVREKNKLSQYELAKKSGLTRRGILQIEKHKRDPRLSNAYKIAKALNCSIEEIFIFE